MARRGLDHPADQVRNAFVRGEHSAEGKAGLSTRRSVPMASRLARELDRRSTPPSLQHRRRLVYAHPHARRPIDRSKVTRRFRNACHDAGVRVITFHNLRRTFATRLAAQCEPPRTIQELLSHADDKTTQARKTNARDTGQASRVCPTMACRRPSPVGSGRRRCPRGRPAATR